MSFGFLILHTTAVWWDISPWNPQSAACHDVSFSYISLHNIAHSHWVYEKLSGMKKAEFMGINKHKTFLMFIYVYILCPEPGSKCTLLHFSFLEHFSASLCCTRGWLAAKLHPFSAAQWSLCTVRSTLIHSSESHSVISQHYRAFIFPGCCLSGRTGCPSLVDEGC